MLGNVKVAGTPMADGKDVKSPPWGDQLPARPLSPKRKGKDHVSVSKPKTPPSPLVPLLFICFTMIAAGFYFLSWPSTARANETRSLEDKTYVAPASQAESSEACDVSNVSEPGQVESYPSVGFHSGDANSVAKLKPEEAGKSRSQLHPAALVPLNSRRLVEVDSEQNRPLTYKLQWFVGEAAEYDGGAIQHTAPPPRGYELRWSK